MMFRPPRRAWREAAAGGEEPLEMSLDQAVLNAPEEENSPRSHEDSLRARPARHIAALRQK